MGVSQSMKPYLGLNLAGFIVERGRYFLGFGPVGAMVEVQSANAQNFITRKHHVTGFHVTYQYRPHSLLRRFDFFFAANFIWQKHKETFLNNYDNSQYFNPYIVRSDGMDGQIGYGYRLKFLKHFYLSNFVGLGLNENHVFSDNVNNTEDNRISQKGLGYVINITLGYRRHEGD